MIHEFLQKLANKTAPKVSELEQKAEDAIVSSVQKKAPGLSPKIIIFLTTLVLIFIALGGYAIYWKYLRSDKPNSNMEQVITQGGGTVQTGSQVPAVAKASKKGKAKTKTETRPVEYIPDDELPPEEVAKIPNVPPIVGVDNVPRKIQLGDTQVVPPSRGEVYTRAYILPDGKIKIYQDPQKEKFWGLPWKDSNWKRIELEGRLGLFGNTQAKGTARWLPLRTGDIQYGPEISVGTELGGIVRAEGMLMFRLEPFRKSYR